MINGKSDDIHVCGIICSDNYDEMVNRMMTRSTQCTPVSFLFVCLAEARNLSLCVGDI